MRIQIRKAKREDLPTLVRLLFQVQAVHAEGRPDLFRQGARKYSDDEIEAILANDGETPVFVAIRNGAVVGYAFCVIETPKATASLKSVKTLYIDDLCVDEMARGEHIGTELYQYVTEFARTIGCQRMTLNVWCLNESAMRFYEKRGLSPLKITMEALL